MIDANKLKIGDISNDGKVTIVDEDRLCYLVRSVNNGASGIRTISKSLLSEFIDYFSKHFFIKGQVERWHMITDLSKSQEIHTELQKTYLEYDDGNLFFGHRIHAHFDNEMNFLS